MSNPVDVTHLVHLGVLLGLGLLVNPCGTALAHDWPDWRGPTRDGLSTETGLPTTWSPDGENLAWRIPYGGRSAPIVVGDHVYLLNSVGEGEDLQERVMAFDAETGTLEWEYRFNVYLSDVPPHRVGWSSPTGDPATGHIYVLGVGGRLLSLTADGDVRWERSLAEDFGLITTHGGRTVSPVIDEDLIIVSGLSSGWGNHAIGRHRFMAFDKNTGDTLWVSTPGGRAFDTTYSTPIITDIDGTRMLIAGSGDGAVHALKPQTGESIWKYVMSKRGINTEVVVSGMTVFMSHGEENLGTSEMGLLAAIDATGTGEILADAATWRVTGFQGGYSSPVVDGNRVYQVDNSANLAAFDLERGTKLWEINIGTIQKSSPVFADGKLYVGSVTGRFFILEPGPDECAILSEAQLGSVDAPEEILGSVAIANGRVYVVTDQALYAIGPTAIPSSAMAPIARAPATADPAISHVRVAPTELVIEPGATITLGARTYDARGRSIGDGPVTWSLEGLEGTISSNGGFTAASDAGAQAGMVHASAAGITGAARIRVIPALPTTYDFDADPAGGSPPQWIASTGKFEIRDIEGNHVLVKLADNPFTRRARVYIGDSSLSDYTVEADISAIRRRRQMGDVGVTAQRHVLVLMGNHQRLELQTWQPETERTVTVPFPWQNDTWYRMKLMVENLETGTVRARGKVWPRDEPEPEDWTVERIDRHPHRKGSPGIYANAPFEIFFDNISVHQN